MALMRKAAFAGRVETLLAKRAREGGFEKQACESLRLTFAGPEGDCHAGLTRAADSRTLLLYPRGTEIRNVRQVTVVSASELEQIAANMGLEKIEASWLGANMVLSGIPSLTLLPPSTRLQFPSGATLVVDMENAPCTQVAKVIVGHCGEKGHDFVKAATHLRGVTAWVEREGEVKASDSVTVFLPPPPRFDYG